MNKQIYYEDIYDLSMRFKFKEEIKNKKFLITGGTGLLGSYIINFLNELNNKYDLNIVIYGLARNKDKVYELGLSSSCHWVYVSMEELISFDYDVDYIIHTASPTQSVFLSNNPVETIESNVFGAINLINIARKLDSKIIYISSIEVYGEIFDDTKLVNENVYGIVNQLNPRSGYPESKKLIECLLASYGQEYNLDFNIIRLTQTFGAGIDKNDNRIFAYIAKSIINNNDIVLKTNGQSSKPYIYISDAVNAIFYIIFNGKSKETYNVANDKTYISVYDMADTIINEFNPKINLKIEISDEAKMFAPITKIKLDITKLEKLGFKPKYNLIDMYSRLIDYLK